MPCILSYAMPFAHYQPFYLEDREALKAEIDRLALDIPLSSKHELLGASLEHFRPPLANRFCAQPIAGLDATPDGAPGPLTLRRYRRLAAGGFSVVWIESTVPGPEAPPATLRLDDDTVDAFSKFIEDLRTEPGQDGVRKPVFILQLTLPWQTGDPENTEAPQFPPESKIAAKLDALVQAAALAAQAGFDGIDVACTQGTLPHALLSASRDAGKFGGNFENRTRFLGEAVARIRQNTPDLLIATRLLAYQAARNGFGVDAADYRRPDLSEPSWLARILRDAGLDLLNLVTAAPRLTGPAETRPFRPVPDGAPPEEHPLQTLARHLHIARTLHDAVPGLPIIGSGFAWLRQFLPDAAAGAIASGAMDIVGLGREALACPDAPARILDGGAPPPESTCIVCFACAEMAEHGGPVGCPIRDPETYGPEFRRQHRHSPERLARAARRCHLCEHAPCSKASRTSTDIPGFIAAFREGDPDRAYRIIRRADPLPELTARLTPGWLHSEGVCVETTLTGTPVPILDIQLSIAWQARRNGQSALRLAPKRTGKCVTIAGAGPAGLAAAIRLLEAGHDVEIYERSESLGGTPELLIPRSRFPGARGEIDAILAPALESQRLRIFHGMELGANLALEDLRRNAAATLLAAGLWQEKSPFADSARPAGATDALAFLASARRGETTTVPPRVAILSGGDAAMDAARTAEQLGAREIFIVFPGPRSEMHWHLAEEWFAEPGHHALVHCRPLGYQSGPDGNLASLRIRHTLLETESELPVALVIEATGLKPAETLRSTLVRAGVEFNEHGLVQLAEGSRTTVSGLHAAGALTNGGASVARCIAEGLAAAEEIHRRIS